MLDVCLCACASVHVCVIKKLIGLNTDKMLSDMLKFDIIKERWINQQMKLISF